jgi:hypothetical protein
VIGSVDFDTGAVKSCVEHVSPPEVCPGDDPSVLFKSATIVDRKLYVPTATEVLVYDVPSFSCSRHASLRPA